MPLVNDTMTGAIKDWVRARPRARRLALLARRLVVPVVSLDIASLARYAAFIRQWWSYSRQGGGAASVLDWYPCLRDRWSGHDIDAHYFYQDVWAFGRILDARPPEHVDIGSHAPFVGMLTTVTNVTFIDIRPMTVWLDSYRYSRGSILALPYPDGSVASLSSLSVAEHIGLGRYGDELDPEGTAKACRELVRVLAPGGSLYFSLPIGRPRVCFNAHRVHTASQIVDACAGLTLREFSGVDDCGRFERHRLVDSLDHEEYGCGFFWFEKSR